MIRIQFCQTCRFFMSAPDMNAPPYVSRLGTCFRYPKAESKALNNQCGEWKLPLDPAACMCLAKGPMIVAVREEQPAIMVRGIPALPRIPARPAIYRTCALPKDHTGDHSDGEMAWMESES